MQRPGYERFALVSNPFHDLASESVEEIEVYHVTQEADEAFERMKQEVLEKSRKAFVMVVGPLGSGKTQRLRVTAGQADAVEAFSHYLNLGEAPPDPIAAIAGALVGAVDKRKLAKGFSPPRWSKDLQAIAKGKMLNPETAGRTLAEALNALAPSYLLLNDVDALHGKVEEHTLHTMLALVSHLQDGVMVAVACQQPHFAKLNQKAGPLMSRVNRVLQLRGLTEDEAELLLAKRMAGRRLIEDLDPLYPFTKAAVAEVNRAAGGSPRRLLQLADLVLDSAVKERAFQIGPELAAAALARAGAIVEHAPVTTAVPRTVQGTTPAKPVPIQPVPTKPVAGAAPVTVTRPVAQAPATSPPAHSNGLTAHTNGLANTNGLAKPAPGSPSHAPALDPAPAPTPVPEAPAPAAETTPAPAPVPAPVSAAPADPAAPPAPPAPVGPGVAKTNGAVHRNGLANHAVAAEAGRSGLLARMGLRRKD